jgi:hypothetical protein
MELKSRMGRGRLVINKNPGMCQSEQKDLKDGRRGKHTFPCTGRECTGVDEKVLPIVEQAHSCAGEVERSIILING